MSSASQESIIPKNPSWLVGRRERAGIIEMLERWHWTHFITLATNDMCSIERARRLVRSWDARMNRKMLGPKWTSKPDERLFAFYFPENPETNTHWHALVMLDSQLRGQWLKQHALLVEETQPIWRKLVPSGTSKVLFVTNDVRHRARRYVAKQIDDPLCYSNFVVPREFE